MKTLFAALLLAFAGSASAASVAIKPPVGITGNPASATGWTTASNFVGNFSAASFSGGFTTNVGGKAVTMPATMRMAANAGQFAISAVRASPAALIGSAVVAWLLANGIEYVEGQFVKPAPSPGIGQGYQWGCAGIYGEISSIAVTCAQASGWGVITITEFVPNGADSYVVKAYSSKFSGGPYTVATVNKYTQCLAGYTLQNGACVGSVVPVTDSDFSPLATAPLPDSVASELAPKGVALPMESPQFDPPYVDVPLGDPYEDPTTGKRYRDNARVTPQSDGKTADVQTTKQEVDEAGEPVTDPATGIEKPPEKQDDFCKQNPDSLACMEKGETDELDLETRSIGSMVSPVAVGGAGHCMADKTLAMATMGRSITVTYKPICDLATMVRPLILALAWLLAGWIMIGAVKEN